MTVMLWAMSAQLTRKIIDLEWPRRYVLECGHEVAIAPDASVADMAMPGQALPCPTCAGEIEEAPPPLLTRFKTGEAINALTINDRLAEIEARLKERGLAPALTLFKADEPINADTLNRRLEEIERALGPQSSAGKSDG